MSKLLTIITTGDAAVRDTALAEACEGLSLEELLAECEELDRFRREAENLYERVRALFFLHAIHRYHLLYLFFLLKFPSFWLYAPLLALTALLSEKCGLPRRTR